jgi:hypothetical protein
MPEREEEADAERTPSRFGVSCSRGRAAGGKTTAGERRHTPVHAMRGATPREGHSHSDAGADTQPD